MSSSAELMAPRVATDVSTCFVYHSLVTLSTLPFVALRLRYIRWLILVWVIFLDDTNDGSLRLFAQSCPQRQSLDVMWYLEFIHSLESLVRKEFALAPVSKHPTCQMSTVRVRWTSDRLVP